MLFKICSLTPLVLSWLIIQLLFCSSVWRFGIVVFSLAKGRSWRISHHLFYPNPDACDYTVNRVNFQWTDGVFGMSLSPVNEPPDRLLFFRPMSSYGVSGFSYS